MPRIETAADDAACDTRDDRHAAAAQTPNRRDFLRAAGLGGGALVLAACGADAVRLTSPAATPTAATVGGSGITLNFADERDVLNYAYALEQLEAAFYDRVVTNAAFSSAFAANEQRVLRDLRDHELVHRDFFAAVLGSFRIPNLTPDFSAVTFSDRTSVLQTARTFEDLGVSAYNGAARYIKTAAYLTVAGKIVSVEARHASAIRGILEPRSGAFAPNAFDAPNTPSAVLGAADPFIVESITVINA